jgi:hypothetical protein
MGLTALLFPQLLKENYEHEKFDKIIHPLCSMSHYI